MLTNSKSCHCKSCAGETCHSSHLVAPLTVFRCQRADGRRHCRRLRLANHLSNGHIQHRNQQDAQDRRDLLPAPAEIPRHIIFTYESLSPGACLRNMLYRNALPALGPVLCRGLGRCLSMRRGT